MSRRARAALAPAGMTAAAHLLPSVATIPAVHRRLWPGLAGSSDRAHVALTFDDGPDPASTPLFLETLDRLDIKATFFLLGCQVQRNPQLAQRIVAEGHEVAVHGWRHRPQLLQAPWDVFAELARTRDLIAAATGARPRFVRPPNGVISGAGLAAARSLGLRTILWTADGRDWEAAATAHSVLARIGARLEAGGVVLLHDSDVTSAPGSWRAALAALPSLLQLCSQQGWQLGSVFEHWQE